MQERELEKLNKELKALQKEVTDRDNLKETNRTIIENEHTLRKEHRTLEAQHIEVTNKAKYLEQQLNGLTDIFNEIYISLDEQNKLLEMFVKTNKYRKEHIDRVIQSFNTPKGDEKV